LAILNAAGSNIIRICLQLDKFMTSKNTFNQSQFDKLYEFLDLAAKYDIYVIINGANTWVSANQPDWLNFISEQDRWLTQANFWQEIARQVGSHPAVAWYSLINEPLDNLNTDAKVASFQENSNDTIDIYSEPNAASYINGKQGPGYAIISNEANDAFELISYQDIRATPYDGGQSPNNDEGFYLSNATKLQYGNYNRINNNDLPNCYISLINKLPDITNLKVQQTTAGSKQAKIDIAADSSFKSFKPVGATVYQNNISFFGNSYTSATTSNYVAKTGISQFNSGTSFIGINNVVNGAPVVGDYVSGNGISTTTPVTVTSVSPYGTGYLITISSATVSNQTSTTLTFETPSQLIGVTSKNKRYSTKLTSLLSSVTEINYAVQDAILSSSSGYGQIFKNLPNGNQETQNPVSGSTYRMHSVNFGKDDYLSYGANYGYNSNFFIQSLRVILSRLKSNSVTELPATGSFVNITDTNASGGSYLRVTNSGASASTYSYPTFSTSSGFAGGTIAIGFMVENGKSAQVEIILNQGVVGKEKTYRQSLISGTDVRSGITAPVVQRIPSVPSGVNTIDIKLTVAAGSTGCLDYWQIESSNPAPIIVHSILEFPNSREFVSRWNDEIKQLIFNEFFNESVFYFDVNSQPVLNLVSNTTSTIDANIYIDGNSLSNGLINDSGHSKIADAFKTLMSNNGLLFNTGVTVDGTTYTYTTESNHNLTIGDTVIIKNVTPSTSNGAFTVTSINGSQQFSVSGVANPTGLSATNGQFAEPALAPNTSYFIESASLPSSSKLGFTTNSIVGSVDTNGQYIINLSNSVGITTSTTPQTCLIYNNQQWINGAFLSLDRHYNPYVTLTTRGRDYIAIAESWINQMINYIRWQDPSTKLIANDANTPITLGVLPDGGFDRPSLFDIRSPHQYIGGVFGNLKMYQIVDNLKNIASTSKPVILEEGAIPSDSPRTLTNYLLKSKKYLAGALNNYQAHGVWKTDPYNAEYAIAFDLAKPFFQDAIADDVSKSTSVGSTSPNTNVPFVTGRRYLTPVFDENTVVISGTAVNASNDVLPAGTYKYVVMPSENLSRVSNSVDVQVNGSQKPRLKWPTINFDESVSPAEPGPDPFINNEDFAVYRYSRPTTSNPSNHYYYVGNAYGPWYGSSTGLYQFTDTYAGTVSNETTYRGFDIAVLTDDMTATATRVPISDETVFYYGYNKICIDDEIMYYSRIYYSGGVTYLDVGEPLQTGTITGTAGSNKLTFSAGIPETTEYGYSTPLWVPGMTLVKTGTITNLPNSVKITDVDVANKRITIATTLSGNVNATLKSTSPAAYVTGGRGATTDKYGASAHGIGANIYQIFDDNDVAREKGFDFYTTGTDPLQPSSSYYFYGVPQDGSYISQTQLTKSPSVPALGSVTYINTTAPTDNQLTFYLNSITPGYQQTINSLKTNAYIKIANVSSTSPSEVMRVKLYNTKNNTELTNARLTLTKTSGTNWFTSSAQSFTETDLDGLQLINSISTKDLQFSTAASNRNLSIFTEYVEINMTEKLSRQGTPVATIV